jgi:hypothetical protein
MLGFTTAFARLVGALHGYFLDYIYLNNSDRIQDKGLKGNRKLFKIIESFSQKRIEKKIEFEL